MTRLLTCAAASAVLFVAACAQQQEEPAPVIQGEPTYDKFGSINGCEDGVYIPGAAPIDQCLPPDDECEPSIDSAGQEMPCPPTFRGQDPLEGDDPQRPRSPNDTGAVARQ